MDTIKKILTPVFVTLGIIFVILLLGAGYMYANNTFGMRASGVPYSALQKSTDTSANTASGGGTKSTTQTTSGSTGFTLNASQKAALQAFGIDPNSLPSTISADQVACFESKLGVSRVAEIKAGATPSMSEFFKARACI